MSALTSEVVHVVGITNFFIVVCCLLVLLLRHYFCGANFVTTWLTRKGTSCLWQQGHPACK